jgi:anaerobic magnesium-protoporphyrin IX monomethyl ester cyclase
MKILLINPPLIANSGANISVSYGEPLGLAYVAAAVEKSGRHKVEVLDAMGLATDFVHQGDYILYGLSYDEVLLRMRAMSFDAVGITITKMYDDGDQIPRLCHLIRDAFPNIPVIIGGPDVTLEWSSYMKLGTVDYAVIGEGETTIVQLLDYLDGRGSLDGVNGIAYLENGKVKMAPQGPAVEIADIPWPARHLFPMENYFRNKAKATRGRKRRTAAILTSRACPYSCAFCSTIEVWGRKWRGRPAKDVVDEIEHLVKTYNVGEVVVFDDNFLVDRDRVEAIADDIIARKLNIALRVAPGLMIHLLNHNLLRKLRRAGLSSVQMQVESGNPETLEYIDKHIDISKAKELVNAAHSVGLQISTNVLIGFYFEDRAAIERSIRTVEAMGFDKVDYMLAEPKPGTRMYRDWVKSGIFEDGNPAIMPVNTLHFKGPELAEILAGARRLHQRNRKMRFFKLETWYRYFIPMYIYNPHNIVKAVRYVIRGVARKALRIYHEELARLVRIRNDKPATARSH